MACFGRLVQASIGQPADDTERAYRASSFVCERGQECYQVTIYASADEVDGMLSTFVFG